MIPRWKSDPHIPILLSSTLGVCDLTQLHSSSRHQNVMALSNHPPSATGTKLRSKTTNFPEHSPSRDASQSGVQFYRDPTYGCWTGFHIRTVNLAVSTMVYGQTLLYQLHKEECSKKLFDGGSPSCPADMQHFRVWSNRYNRFVIPAPWPPPICKQTLSHQRKTW